MPVSRNDRSRLLVRFLLDDLDIEAFAASLGRALLRVRRPHRAERGQVPLELELLDRRFCATKPLLECLALLEGEPVVIAGSDELVLASVDERDDVRVRVVVRRVVQQPQTGHEIAQEQQLADAVEDVRPARQPRLASVIGQDPLAEAVEVADRHPRRTCDADGRLDPLAQLGGRLHVMSQDEEVLGEQSLAGLEQVPHTLDDDPRLAGPRASDHDGRSIAPLDDAALLHGQVASKGRVIADP